MELDLRGELQIGGVWVDATGNLLQRQALTHTRGRQDQGARVDPSACQPLLNNTNGQFSPDNPMGPYYGNFGRNTPFRLSVRAGSPALDLPGSINAVASTPDTAALDITGDIDVRVDATLSNWTTYSTSLNTTQLIGKLGLAAGTKSWFLGTRSGFAYFEWSADGSAALSASSLVPLPVPASGRMALRATLDVNNGAGGRTITFYTAETIAGPWTQLGAPVVQAGTTSIFNSTLPLRIGRATDVNFTQPTGRVHKAEVRNGIGGPVVAGPDFAAQTVGAASFVDAAGLTWTVGSPASISNRRIRLSHELAAYPTRWHPSGKHVWVEAQTAGILRRLGRGTKALDSTLRRRIPSYGPLAYWPLEDGQSATQAASPIAGVRPLSLSRVDWASADSLPSSNPLPVLASGGGELPMMYGRIPAPATTQTSWQVQWIYRLDQANTTLNTYMRILSTGTVREWYIQQRDTEIRIIGKDDDGGTVFTNSFSTGPDLFGQWIQVRFEVNQDGANVDWRIVFTDVGGDAGQADGTFVGTVGRPTAVASPPDGYSPNLDGLALGHISAWAPWVGGNGFTAYEGAIEAWTGETAGERMQRLASEESLPLTVCGVVSEQERVGPQRPDAMLTLLQDAADADGGILYEDRERPALRYRDRAGMYNQTPALVLDYNAPGLAPPLEPTGDDDATANDVTVSRTGGSSARAVLEEGALSVQAPPKGVGPYDTSVTLNLHSDDQTEPQAYWRLHHGTYEGRRYPQVHVMVHQAPGLADQILATDVGDKIVIRNPPPWLAPGDIELIVQGYEETFSSEFQWDIVFNCTPAAPWTVGVVGDTTLGRVDTDGSQLVSAATASTTTLTVRATEGPPWTTDPAEFPFDVRIGGEVMTATAISSAARDAFGRTISGGWGSADAGGAWTTIGGSDSDYAVGSGIATHTMTSVNVSRRCVLTAPSADVDLYVDIATSVLSTGGFQSGGLMARVIDGNNLYYARVEFSTSQQIILSIRKRLTGTETTLATLTTSLAHVAGAFVRLRFEVVGSLLRAKTWAVGAGEPAWQVTATDPDLTDAGTIGVRSILSSANTNINPQARYDNFACANPQTWTVTRSVNAISKSHAAGTDVRLATPAVVAL